MLDKEDILKRLKNMNLSAVAREADIPYRTLVNFTKGSNTGIETVERLSKYLEDSTN